MGRIVVRMNEGRFPKRDEAEKLSGYRENAQTKMEKRRNMKLSNAVDAFGVQLPRRWRDNNHVLLGACTIIPVVVFSTRGCISNGRSETRIIL